MLSFSFWFRCRTVQYRPGSFTTNVRPMGSGIFRGNQIPLKGYIGSNRTQANGAR
jgi:hypothetical protein